MQAHTDAIRPHAQSKTYKKGATVVFQGEIPRFGSVVVDGIVRSYTIASNGEEQTISFHADQDVIPMSWLMDTTSNVLFYYEALTDVRVLQFRRDDFRSAVLENPAVAAQFLQRVSRDYTAAMMRINGLEQSRADEKVASALYYLLFRFGKKIDDERYCIDITLRHSVLASLVGISRESATKVLRQLQNKAIISYERGIYTVNKQKLENFIGEDAFRDVSLT